MPRLAKETSMAHALLITTFDGSPNGLDGSVQGINLTINQQAMDALGL